MPCSTWHCPVSLMRSAKHCADIASLMRSAKHCADIALPAKSAWWLGHPLASLRRTSPVSLGLSPCVLRGDFSCLVGAVPLRPKGGFGLSRWGCCPLASLGGIWPFSLGLLAS